MTEYYRTYIDSQGNQQELVPLAAKTLLDAKIEVESAKFALESRVRLEGKNCCPLALECYKRSQGKNLAIVTENRQLVAVKRGHDWADL